MSDKGKQADSDWFIPEESRKTLTEIFAKLKEPVEIELYSAEGVNQEYTEFAERFLGDILRLTKKVSLKKLSLDSDQAKERGVNESPTLVIAPDRYDIRYIGAPAGEEGRSLIETILLASLGNSGLSEVSRQLLAELDEKREAKVFVSPTCPYCPFQAGNAVKAAVERPEFVSARIIEINENPELADKHGVGSVPHTIVNDTFSSLGMEPEERFMVQLLSLKPAEEMVAHHHGPDEATQIDLAIVGGGPAGLAAAIYAGRGGLSSVVIEGANLGGQVAVTPNVENYPGFAAIPGGGLVDVLAAHARQYAKILEFEKVNEIKVGKRIEVHTDKHIYVAYGVILATGAVWKKLQVPGEDRLFGNGVSYCSTCDGQLYKKGRVFVVGGGNTALTDALYLKNLGADVSVIHRRDKLRAENQLMHDAEVQRIPFIFNTVVTEITGKDKVRGVRLKDVATGKERREECDAVFVAIGEVPASRLAREIGVQTDDYGDIVVDRHMRTNIPRVYAAGDVTGGVRQIVTAVSEGSVAAMTAFEDISSLRSRELEEKEESAP